MDYEKKYKQALELARDYYKANLKLNNADENLLLEDIFPELRGDEDEKIRKALVRFHKSTIDIDGIKGADILAWLEKQGDNNNQNWKPSKGQINALEHFVRSIGESGYTSPYDDNTNLLNSLINDLYKLEKQGEQKTAAWSDEDEHRVEDTIYFLDTAKKHYACTIELDACIDWLKSLKDRMVKED